MKYDIDKGVTLKAAVNARQVYKILRKSEFSYILEVAVRAPEPVFY